MLHNEHQGMPVAMRVLMVVVGLLCLSSFAARPWSNGAVAAAHPMGSAAGKDILEAGGNAVDAAVAAAFTMAVVGPYHSGLGGGGFAVLHLNGADASLDFRETAPRRASRDMFLVNGALDPVRATDGALAVAVPGAVKGYLELHAKYGKLSRAKVLAPAIRAALEGFVVTPKYKDLAKKREACLNADAEAARIFLRDGKVPELGVVIKQPELAKTLGALARQGDAAFYSGAIARAIATTLQSKGGVLSVEDLAEYRTAWRAPLEGRYRGHRIVTVPPPSGGGLTLLETFGILETHQAQGPASRQVDALHVFIEALRRAYADRGAWVGDPDFVEVPVERLLNPLALASVRIDRARASTSSALPMESSGLDPLRKNTTHISVVDREGNAVALTTTINYYFGSCVVAKGTGVLLNDEMDDFAAQPGVPNTFGLVMGEANAIAAKKRPASSMTPTLVFMRGRDHEVLLAVGSPGGSTIPTTVMQVISNVVDGEFDVVRAVGRGRIHHQWWPDEVWVDADGLDPETQRALEAKGHTFRAMPGWGDAEAVMVDPTTGLKSAASDPRNEGQASGY
jgi:gamma-glutamyltranspeptidase / glutathione hydrolase